MAILSYFIDGASRAVPRHDTFHVENKCIALFITRASDRAIAEARNCPSGDIADRRRNSGWRQKFMITERSLGMAER
jgi:hypothetical protein